MRASDNGMNTVTLNACQYNSFHKSFRTFNSGLAQVNAAFALEGNKWIKIEDERTDRVILWNALIDKSDDGKTPLMMETGGKYLNDLHNQCDIEYQNAINS